MQGVCLQRLMRAALRLLCVVYGPKERGGAAPDGSELGPQHARA